MPPGSESCGAPLGAIVGAGAGAGWLAAGAAEGADWLSAGVAGGAGAGAGCGAWPAEGSGTGCWLPDEGAGAACCAFAAPGAKAVKIAAKAKTAHGITTPNRAGDAAKEETRERNIRGAFEGHSIRNSSWFAVNFRRW